jgi:hypothetical protein
MEILQTKSNRSIHMGFTAPVVNALNASAFKPENSFQIRRINKCPSPLSLLTLTTQNTKYRIFKKLQLIVT